MASQPYESVTKNDAKRDALKNKKPAKSLTHPKSDIETARRARKARERQKEIADRRSNKPTSTAKANPPAMRPQARGTESVTGAKPAVIAPPTPSAGNLTISPRAAAMGGGATQPPRPGATPTVRQAEAASAPKQTPTAVRSGDIPPSTAKPTTAGVTGAEHKEPLTGRFTGYSNLLQAKPYPAKKTNGAKAPPPGGSTKPAASSKPKGSVGAASNRDLPGRTTLSYRDKKGNVTTTTTSATANPSLPASKPKPSTDGSKSLGAPRTIHPAKPTGKRAPDTGGTAATTRAYTPSKGGGAETALQGSRGNPSHFYRREK